LEADVFDDNSDGDSTWEHQSDTTSISSSIRQYRYENGRTYHSYKANEGVAYFLPNDDREVDRLDLQHAIMVMMQGNQLYLSPAGKEGKPFKRVLDIGTGSGIWAMEFADMHPEASVIGNDISVTQPDFVVPNVEFFIEDVEENWDYHTPFDFIYSRMMTGSIKNWQRLIDQAYENLTPGGWLEICDPINPVTCDDGTLPPDSYLLKWNSMILEASLKLGTPLNSALKYKEQLEKAGFVNIKLHKFKWPINSWPRDRDAKLLGSLVYENICGNAEGLSLMLFTNILGWSVEEVQVLLSYVRKEFVNKNIHAYWDVYTVYGQKPE